MTDFHFPGLKLASFELAEMKDSVLNFLFTKEEKQWVEVIYESLKGKYKREDFDMGIFQMIQDHTIVQAISFNSKEEYIISDSGDIFIRQGGYTELAKLEFNEFLEKSKAEKKAKEKLDLEIKNLNESLRNFKRTKIISWVAIIISALSLFVAIFKDIIFK